jgi:type II secretory ATPase GspE/PulE/Tfp pilus assembly ATPase PilB-like protein
MIGEIRDNETAQIAVRAALTGHLVLSTLHTNNASGVPPRLLDMEVESFLVASTLNLVIAQRLVRKICTDCIESYHLTPDRLLSLSKEFNLEKMMARFKTLNLVDPTANTFADLVFYRGAGCTRCHTTGYSGRIGVMELLENNGPMQEAIIRRASTADIEKLAFEQGMINIFEDGLQKALLGVTTIEEVLRIKRE